jgi:hypothetical protein
MRRKRLDEPAFLARYLDVRTSLALKFPVVPNPQP